MQTRGSVALPRTFRFRHLLVPLALSAVFLSFAAYLFRLRYRGLSSVPLLTGLCIVAATIYVKVQDEQRTHARQDADLLLASLGNSELWRTTEPRAADRRLLLASTASQALMQTKSWYPERDSSINATLRILANFAANTDRFPAWKSRNAWNNQVFFLAHAGATLAHYELTTKRNDRAGEIGYIAAALAKHLPLTQYRHLPSRADEAFFRPADNAAAVYTLSLFERLGYSDRFEAVFNDWEAYLGTELYYEESRLPCAAFSPTNRCQLEPSAAATGLYAAYRAAAQGRVDGDIPFREWLHYFKDGASTPFTLGVKQDMRKDQQTRFCNQGASPLKCGLYEKEIGLWLAALYDGDYTYFRLFSNTLLREWMNEPPDYAAMKPEQRAEALQAVVFRLLGQSL